MGQQEYDAFRERMKQWMLDNADAYDEFEEMMNSQSDIGYQKIMAQAMALVPKYSKAISKKMNRSSIDDTVDIDALFRYGWQRVHCSCNDMLDGEKKKILLDPRAWIFARNHLRPSAVHRSKNPFQHLHRLRQEHIGNANVKVETNLSTEPKRNYLPKLPKHAKRST